MLRIQNLHKAFGKNEILKGVNLDVNKGDVVVIIGPFVRSFHEIKATQKSGFSRT